MNELKTFENERFGNVRVTMIDNEPWFVVADVCKALELGNPSMTVDRLDDDERVSALLIPLVGNSAWQSSTNPDCIRW